MLKIIESVGKNGKNQISDVKKIRVLLNCYLRSKSKTGLIISGKADINLEEAIALFQKDYVGSSKPDSKIDVNGKSYNKLKEFLNSIFKPVALSPPTYGIVTWESEGAEGGPYHSRKLHVPSTSSGLTLGRGYDFRRKSQSKIYNDLTSSGVDAKIATILKQASELFGVSASQFVIDKDLLDLQISGEVQKNLFKISYDIEKSEVKRICEKALVKKTYGTTDWSGLHSTIKDMAIDLKFRGDYTPSARKIIQKSIAENNLTEFKKKIKDKRNWSNVPPDRFIRRSSFMDKT